MTTDASADSLAQAATELADALEGPSRLRSALQVSVGTTVLCLRKRIHEQGDARWPNCLCGIEQGGDKQLVQL
ncbi:hypothetical protein [Aromatoleum anaerobium]|uniref:hypothetical protein n=1 Tax=Aromatoleum anaerobium TaxID=182180 RepID=UPI001B7CEC61|nr:hypothetical protein [Aromatoleum anaerobium]MCK0505770.1 hypothetical protein [Aromatoleum anaerobium]